MPVLGKIENCRIIARAIPQSFFPWKPDRGLATFVGKHHKITVYVKSVKTVTGTQEIERELVGPYVGHAPSRIGVEGKRSDGTFRLRQFEKIVEPEYKFILPDDQQSFVETVKEVASSRGIEVEVVDVTMENLLRREIQKHVKDISVYPTVIADDGKRVEGNATRAQLEEFLA